MSKIMQQQEELQEDILEDFLEDEPKELLEDEEEDAVQEKDLQEERQMLQYSSQQQLRSKFEEQEQSQSEEQEQGQSEEQEQQQKKSNKTVTYYENPCEDVDSKVEQHFARALSASASHQRLVLVPCYKKRNLTDKSFRYNTETTFNLSPLASTHGVDFTHISNPTILYSHSSSSRATVGPSFPTTPFSPSCPAWNDGSNKEDRIMLNVGNQTFSVGVPPITIQPNIDPFGDLPRLPGESRGTNRKEPLPPPMYLLGDSTTGSWNKANATQPGHADTPRYMVSPYSPASPHVAGTAHYSLCHLSPSASPVLPKLCPPTIPTSTRFQNVFPQQAIHQPTTSLSPKYIDPIEIPAEHCMPYHSNEVTPYQTSTLNSQHPTFMYPTSSMSGSFQAQPSYHQYPYIQDTPAMSGSQNPSQSPYPQHPHHHQQHPYNYAQPPPQFSYYPSSQLVPLVEGAHNAPLPSASYMPYHDQWEHGDATYHSVNY